MIQKQKHFARKEKVFGQFMTPVEVANFIVDFAMICLKHKPRLAIDPACGDGVFLRALLRKGIDEVVGVDIDEKVIPLDLKDKCKIFAPKDGLQTLDEKYEGKADIVVGNPPFSAKYGRMTDKLILSRFKLGRGRLSQAIEILFLERFIQLAKSGGIIGIILPSGIFTNIPLQYVRDFIIENTKILGIISLPRRIFKGDTTSKTYILIAEKTRNLNNSVFMGIAETLNDLPDILKAYTKGEINPPKAFWSNITPENLTPEFYYKLVKLELQIKESVGNELKIVKLGDLIFEMRVGKTMYGRARKFSNYGVRYISAKTITPLGIDFSKEDRGRLFVDPGTKMYDPKSHVKVGDLLFVRVGVGCIGRAAVVTNEEERGVADDWIYIIRLKNESLAYFLAFYFYSKYGSSQIDLLKRGVGTVTIPQSLLKEVFVPLLPEKELNKFKEYYLEMVRLRKEGHVSKAQEIFNFAIKSIEELLSKSESVKGDGVNSLVI